MHDIVIRGGSIIDGSGKPAFTGDVAISGGRIAAVGGKQGPARARDRCRRPAGHARLGRRAHPLRRSGDVGPAAGAVVLARRHHGDVRQLRRRLRAGEEGASRRADGPDGGRRGNPQSGARRRPELGVGELPAIHGRARSPRARDRHLRADRASAAARLRDGRPRDPARGGDAGRHRRRCADLTVEALQCGAFGFTTSRTDSHKTPDGDLVPSRDADDHELLGIGSAHGRHRHRRVRHEQRFRRRGVRAALDAQARQGNRPADLVPAHRPLLRSAALAAPDEGGARGARAGALRSPRRWRAGRSA